MCTECPQWNNIPYDNSNETQSVHYLFDNLIQQHAYGFVLSPSLIHDPTSVAVRLRLDKLSEIGDNEG